VGDDVPENMACIAEKLSIAQVRAELMSIRSTLLV
jgi:hypothetical protein